MALQMDGRVGAPSAGLILLFEVVPEFGDSVEYSGPVCAADITNT